ncbi:MAG: hypothetical protein MUE95_04395 [Cyclobacteriaceae bacterium]|jgi:hypothetical protein|nr:hypothetical protein [Cyclobacteriaceae bacterium]
MKSRKSTLLAVFTLSFSVLLAQDYAFRVMSSKGTNEVKSGDSWQPVKVGGTLKAEDELRLSGNSYIGLLHKTNKPMELREAKVYKVSDLASQIGTGSGALNKYTDFILSNNPDDKKNKLSATGAVHRAVDNNPINLMLPESQYSGVYNNIVVVKWDSKVLTGPYTVVISDLYEEELAKIETSETSIRIDLSQPKFAEKTSPAFTVKVTSKVEPNKGSKIYTVKRLSTSDKEKVGKMLSDIQGDLVDQTAFNYFILAGFYESQGLLIDAMAAFEDAVKIEPLYQEDYDYFLQRHGMKR